MNKFWKSLVCAAAALMMLSALVACGKQTPGTEPAAPISGCVVTVKTEGGMALENVDVYVYKDAAKSEMLSLSKTDKDGKAAVAVEVPAGSVVVLEKVPAGYAVEANYPITQADTQITLKTQLLKEKTKIVPGSIMFDFTVTDTEGKTHTLSELLKTNKAVVLNLWYVNCGPCKAEFPYLQRAYDQYGEGVALLCLNCYPEDDEAAVAQFKDDFNINFPMAKIDAAWEGLFEDYMAYPTTIVIDRFGMVSLVHVGGIDDAGVFAGVFQHYAADDYVQSTVADIRSLKIEVTAQGAGTKEEPLEIAGSKEFSVTVAPGATVYCNLYRLSGMEMTVQSENVEILYGTQTFLPENGTVSLWVAATDPNTPTLIAFTNKGTEEATYQVTMSYPAGAMENPYTLILGDFTANIAAGNERGVFYNYTVSLSGTFVLTVKKAPNVEYQIALNNLTTGKYLVLDEDGETDAKGNKTLSVAVNRKDELQIVVSTYLDNQGQYPAAKVELNAAEKVQEVVVPPVTEPEPEPEPDDSEKYNGTLANPDAPVEAYGFNPFSVEVGAGQKMLVNIIRVFNTATFCLEDKDAYVVYKDKLYKPDSTGKIYIRMTGEGTATPLILEVGNIGTAAKTFDISFYYDPGTRENPHALKVGTNAVSCAAGNEQGTYYVYTPAKDGTLTLTLSGVPSGVAVGISINDMAEIPTVVELQEGATSVSIALKAGVEAEITFFTRDPNREWKIPAADFTITATYA